MNSFGAIYPPPSLCRFYSWVEVEKNLHSWFILNFAGWSHADDLVLAHNDADFIIDQSIEDQIQPRLNKKSGV